MGQKHGNFQQQKIVCGVLYAPFYEHDQKLLYSKMIVGTWRSIFGIFSLAKNKFILVKNGFTRKIYQNSAGIGC